jgi:hypothetical protein
MSKYDFSINLDAECKQCGKKGATPSGLCLECITKSIRRSIVNNKIEIEFPRIFDLAFSSKEDKVGIVTKISFELVNIDPRLEAQLKFMQMQHGSINVVFGSSDVPRQLRFDILDVATGELVAETLDRELDAIGHRK